MRIEALGPGDAEAFLDFFDRRAFTDNPAWRSCYCTFFHRPREEVLPEAGEVTNKAYCRLLIEGGIMRGYLARDEAGKILAWCNVNRKDAYPRFRSEPEASITKSLVCFVVDPRERRRGLARALLSRAIEEARGEGYAYFEAYPSRRARTDAGNFKGPAPLYASLGFQELRRGRSYAARLDLRA